MIEFLMLYLPVMHWIGKIGLTFAVWALVSEVKLVVRNYRRNK